MGIPVDSVIHSSIDKILTLHNFAVLLTA